MGPPIGRKSLANCPFSGWLLATGAGLLRIISSTKWGSRFGGGKSACREKAMLARMRGLAQEGEGRMWQILLNVNKLTEFGLLGDISTAVPPALLLALVSI
jgi:hypothetical protein